MRLGSSPDKEQRGSGRRQPASLNELDFQGVSATAGINAASGRVIKADGFGQALLPGQRWFAVQCQANREQGAAMQLRNQDFQVFLPLRRKIWRRARRSEIRRVPFFPGYLFVALDLERDRWRSINGTIGVQRLVMAGGEARPVALPQGLIEALRGRADDRGLLAPETWPEALEVGQRVRIVTGPFDNRLGELIGLDDAGRVRVLVELLGRRIPAVLSRDGVMAAF